MDARANKRHFEMYPTIITPFFEDGSIDFGGLGRLIDMFAAKGCDGIFAVCLSSEMFDMDDREKLSLAAFCIERCHKNGIKCVASGHTQDDIDSQISYLKALAELEPDAVILVSNRLAASGEADDIWIQNLKTVTDALPSDARLGMYECPYPYKRLLTGATVDAMLESGRFDFLKDTCCDLSEIRSRLERIGDSSLKLFNANMATLYESVESGAAGYSGIMLNLSCELFALMKRYLNSEPPRLALAQSIASHLCAGSVIEHQNYPRNAKYLLNRLRIIEGVSSRKSAQPISEGQAREIDCFMHQDRLALYRHLPVAEHELLFAAGSSFASCHASTVLPLPGGVVLAAYFAGDREGADNVGIWLSRRESGHWSKPVRIAKVNETAHWNPVLYETDDGIRIVFKVGKTIQAWESYTTLSRDGGLTWQTPTRLSAPFSAGGPVRSKPVKLSNGRLLAPDSTETLSEWRPRVDISFDNGASFTECADIPINTIDKCRANFISGKGAIQPTLWESAPGRVHAFLRTTCGAIFRSDSCDYGATWSEARSTCLPNNNSGIDIAQHKGALYLAMNLESGNFAARTPLCVMRSRDNGNSFEHYIMLENAPFDRNGNTAEFSYPAIVASEGKLHITFTYMRRTIAYVCVDAE